MHYRTVSRIPLVTLNGTKNSIKIPSKAILGYYAYSLYVCHLYFLACCPNALVPSRYTKTKGDPYPPVLLTCSKKRPVQSTSYNSSLRSANIYIYQANSLYQLGAYEFECAASRILSTVVTSPNEPVQCHISTLPRPIATDLRLQYVNF